MAVNAVSGTWVHRTELEDSCNWVTFVHRRKLMVVLHNDVTFLHDTSFDNKYINVLQTGDNNFCLFQNCGR